MELSEETVRALVAGCLSAEEIRRSLVCWDRRVLAAGEPPGPAAPAVAAPYACTPVFVDLAPGRNWAHPARYLFIDPGSGRCASTPASFPPYLDDPPPSYVVLLRYGEPPGDPRDFRPGPQPSRGGMEP